MLKKYLKDEYKNDPDFYKVCIEVTSGSMTDYLLINNISKTKFLEEREGEFITSLSIESCSISCGVLYFSSI